MFSPRFACLKLYNSCYPVIYFPEIMQFPFKPSDTENEELCVINGIRRGMSLLSSSVLKVQLIFSGVVGAAFY